MDTFQARRAGAWRDTTNIAEGQRGPGPTDQQVTNAVQTGVKPYARTGGGVVPEDEIDAGAIARDSEITRTFLLSTLGLTADELNNLFVGAVVSGSGGQPSPAGDAGGRIDAHLFLPDTTGGGARRPAVPTGW